MVASDPAKKAVILSLKLFNYFVQKLIIYIYFVLACLCSHTYTEFFCGCVVYAKWLTACVHLNKRKSTVAVVIVVLLKLKHVKVERFEGMKEENTTWHKQSTLWAVRIEVKQSSMAYLPQLFPVLPRWVVFHIVEQFSWFVSIVCHFVAICCEHLCGMSKMANPNRKLEINGNQLTLWISMISQTNHIFHKQFDLVRFI